LKSSVTCPFVFNSDYLLFIIIIIIIIIIIKFGITGCYIYYLWFFGCGVASHLYQCLFVVVAWNYFALDYSFLLLYASKFIGVILLFEFTTCILPLKNINLPYLSLRQNNNENIKVVLLYVLLLHHFNIFIHVHNKVNFF